MTQSRPIKKYFIDQFAPLVDDESAVQDLLKRYKIQGPAIVSLVSVTPAADSGLKSYLTTLYINPQHTQFELAALGFQFIQLAAKRLAKKYQLVGMDLMHKSKCMNRYNIVVDSKYRYFVHDIRLAKKSDTFEFVGYGLNSAGPSEFAVDIMDEFISQLQYIDEFERLCRPPEIT